VYKTSYILLSEDNHYYSVPYELIGKRVKVEYNSRTVEIYYHIKRIALYSRNYTANGRTTTAQHLPDNLQFMNEATAEKIISWADAVESCTKELDYDHC